MITIVTVWLCLITHVACDVLITVNNNGSDNDKCCVNGTCPCSSLSSALHVSNNTVINITSESVTLHDIVGMGSGNLSNITITGNGATIMCNNTGGVYCESCSNITIVGITWYQCGRNDSRYPLTQMAALGFTIVSSDILIQDCTFLNSSGCAVYIQNATGNIYITESNFMATVCSIVDDDNFVCSGLFISYKTQIVLVINGSNFDGDGCTFGPDQIHPCFGVVLDSLAGQRVFKSDQFLIQNTNFSNNYFGLFLNTSAANAVLDLLNVKVKNVVENGIFVQMGGGTNDSAGTVSISSATFIDIDAYALFIIADSIRISSAAFVECGVALSISPGENSAHFFVDINNSNFSKGNQIQIWSFANLTFVTLSNVFIHEVTGVNIDVYNPTKCIKASILFTNVTFFNNSSVNVESENTLIFCVIFKEVHFMFPHFLDDSMLLINNHFTDCYPTEPVSIQLIDCTFHGISALDHVASLNVIAYEEPKQNYILDTNIKLSGCNFKDNFGGKSIVDIKVQYFFLMLILDNSTFSNNRGTTLHLINGEIQFKGNILFINNVATNGAAVYLEEQSVILFEDNADVQFIDNYAEQNGGAMFINLFANPYMFPVDCNIFRRVPSTSSVSFINNLAGIAGDSIYFNIPQTCHIITDINNNSSLLYFPSKFNYSQSLYTVYSPVITSPYTIKLHPPAIAMNNSSNYYLIQESKMLGEPIQIIASVFDYFNNITEPVTFSIHCKNCLQNYRLSMYQITVHDHSVHDLKIMPTMHSDIVISSFISLTFLSALPASYKIINASLLIELSPCRAGYIFNYTKCLCYPHPELVHCKEDYVEFKIGYWIGFLTKQYYISSICPNNYCSSEHKESSPGYYRLHGESDDQCSLHRTGVACGECKSGYTLAYDSPECINTDKCSAGMTILVIVLTILYWIAIVAVVFGLMYFQFQISSGYAYGIIYYYSIVDILLVNNVSKGVFQLVAVLSSFANLTPRLFGQLCLVKGLSGIDQQFIHYSHALAVSLILLIIVLVTRYSPRFALFVGRCIIRVLCLLLLLSYTSLASTSLQLLRPLTFNDVNEVRTYSSPDIKYFTGRHLVYAVVAIMCEVIIVIGLPLFLVLEPFLRRRVNLVRIKPLLDQFQGCYKDEYRWFAAYYLICRQVIILIVYVGNGNYYYMLYGLQTTCVIIAMIHGWVQPYKNNLLNGLDEVILLILVLIVNLNLFSLSSFIPTNYLSVVLVILPFLLICFTAIRKLISHFFNKKKRVLHLYNPVETHEDDNSSNERKFNMNKADNNHNEFQDSLLDYSDD